MRQCIIAVGVKGSNKTDWANNFVHAFKEEGENWAILSRHEVRKDIVRLRINKDKIYNSLWVPEWEPFVFPMWNEKLSDLCSDKNIQGVVCIDDENIDPEVRQFITNRFEAAGFEVRVKMFPVSYEEAVRNDLHSFLPIGSSAIARQFESYWRQFETRYIPEPSLPKAIIVDLDSTLAHRKNRGAFDWEHVMNDESDELIVEIIRSLYNPGRCKIIVISARDDTCFKDTQRWLRKHLGFDIDELYMRPALSGVSDVELKKDIFFKQIALKYHVLGAIDDRPAVVRMWHSIGVKTLSVGLQHIEF